MTLNYAGKHSVISVDNRSPLTMAMMMTMVVIDDDDDDGYGVEDDDDDDIDDVENISKSIYLIGYHCCSNYCRN